MEGIGADFSNSLWYPFSSAVDGGIVCDDYIVTCACIVLLHGDCVLVNPGGVENKFINHCSIR